MTTTQPKRAKRKSRGSVVKRGNLWSIRWTDQGDRCSLGGFNTAKEAQLALKVRLAEANVGKIGKLKYGTRRTFDSVIGEFLADRHDYSSVVDDKSRYWKHIHPSLGSTNLQDLDSSKIHKLVEIMEIGPATKMRVISLLSAMYQWSIRENIVGANPVQAYTRFLDRRGRQRLKSTYDPESTPFLTREQVLLIYRGLPPLVQPTFAISALAGLRPGEVLALRWANVDLERKIITVKEQLRGKRLGLPKSGKFRDVPIVPGLYTILKNLQNTPEERVCRVNMRTIERSLTTALAFNGLPKMTLYQCGRHSFASNWVIAGQDIYRLSKILGHSSVVVTQRYAHLGNTIPDSVIQAINMDVWTEIKPIIKAPVIRLEREKWRERTVEELEEGENH